MSESKDDYDEAMHQLHEAHNELIAELNACKAELQKCQEECLRKDETIARLEAGGQLMPSPVARQVAQDDVDNTAPSGFSDDEQKGGESKDEDTSDGTSSGTSDDEESETLPVEDVDLLKKLRF